MSTRRDPFAPYRTADELARGRRQTLVYLAVAVSAVALAIVAQRYVGNPRLTEVYLLAAGLHLLGAVGPAIRWSRTPDLDTALVAERIEP